MIKKQIALFLCCLMLLLTCSSALVSAAAGTGLLAAQNVSAVRGETVEVQVNISNNPGLIALMFDVRYDTTRLALQSVNDGNLFPGATATFGKDLKANPYNLLWENGTATQNCTQNGVVATLTFAVLPDAPLGETFVELTVHNGSTFDYDLNSVSLQTQRGAVQITAAPVTEPTLTIGSAQANPLQSIDIPIMLQNNPGIITMCIAVAYDRSVLELTGVTDGGLFGNCAVFGAELNVSPYTLLWEDGAAAADHTANGVLATLHFNVKMNAPSGLSPIRLTVKQGSTMNWNLDEVCFDTVDGSVDVERLSYILAKAGSTTVVKNGYIYGLHAGITSLDDSVDVKAGCTLEYDPSKTIGTGLIVSAINNNQIVESCLIILFGDVNGDGWYDGTDAYFVRLVANGLLPASVLTDAQRMAADANHDGVIDAADAALLEKAGLLLANVDQSSASEELQTDSVYLEYCSLIDQSIEITEPDQPSVTDEPTAEQGSAANVWQIILDLFKRLFNFVTMIFSIIVIPK